MKMNTNKIKLVNLCKLSIIFIFTLVMFMGLSLLPVAQVEASPGTWYVDGTSGTDDGTHGTGPGADAFKTIQYAINAAAAGDTINVAAGTYNEKPVINKSLTLKAASTESIIDVGGGYDVIKITASNVTIDGFTIQNSKYFLLQTDTSSIQENLTLKNNIFKQGRVQIYKVDNLKFSDNQIAGSPEVWYSSGVISGNTMENVLMGICCTNCNGMTLSDNTIISREGENTDAGIFIQGCSNITIKDNTISGFTSGPRSSYSHGTDGAGIDILTSTSCTVKNNILQNNTLGVLTEKAPENPNIHINDNSFEGNTKFGVLNCESWTGAAETYTSTSITIDATRNWWGAASGPTHTSNPDGTGDAVSDNVLYHPWYDDASCTKLFSAITLNKTGQPASAKPGDVITYTIEYKNEGNFAETGVVITEDYPKEVKFISSDPGPDEGNNNKWTIGDLGPGEGDTITVKVSVE